MKVIELLNKIAKGEEVPKKIKYNKKIYEYEDGAYDYGYYKQNDGTINFLLTDVFNSDDNILSILNEELKIIEEEKEIEKIDLGVLNTQSEKNREFKRAINELIDIVKELKVNK